MQYIVEAISLEVPEEVKAKLWPKDQQQVLNEVGWMIATETHDTWSEAVYAIDQWETKGILRDHGEVPVIVKINIIPDGWKDTNAD